MWRKRETIKRWHKAFIWALLAGVVKGAVAAGKFAGGAAAKGAGMLAKGAGAVGKTALDVGWKAGEKVVGGIVNPAEKAFEAFQKEGIKGGIKQVGKELIDSSDIGKSIDLIKGANNMITGNMPGVPSIPSPVDLGQVDINKPAAPVQAPTAPGAAPVQSGVTPPSTFNQAFLDSLVGKQPDLEGAGRMAYLGDTLADLIRTGVKLDTTKSVTTEDKLDLMKKQQTMERLQASSGDFSPELKSEVKKAMEVINSGGDITKVYMDLASRYPKYTTTLKRIFLPKSATIEQTILGDADTFMGAQ